MQVDRASLVFRRVGSERTITQIQIIIVEVNSPAVISAGTSALATIFRTLSFISIVILG